MNHQAMLPVVLGSGANAYGLVRSLEEAGIPPVVADDHRGAVFFSRLTAGRWLLPSLGQEDRAAAALAQRLAGLPGGAFVIPTNEPWVHLLNGHRGELPPRAHLAMARPEVVELVLRKSAMHRWCLEHRVPQPETVVFHPGQDWRAFLARAAARVPVIIKPDTKGLGDQSLGFATADFQDAPELLQWGQGFNPGGPPCMILAQRFLQGPGVKLSAWHGYRSPGGSLFMVGLSKLRSRPPRLGGCSTAWVVSANRASQNAAVAMLEGLDYDGFFDLEFLIRPGGAPPIFIELNPRPGMPNYAATALGLNLPWLGLTHRGEHGPRTRRIVTDRPGRWVDLSSDPWLAFTGATADGRRWSPRQWLASLRPGPLVEAHFHRRDPLVLLAAWLRLGGLGLAHLRRARRGPRWKASAEHAQPPPKGWRGLRSKAKLFRDLTPAVGPLRMTAASLINRFRLKAVFFQQDLRGPFPEPAAPPGLSWRRVGARDTGLLREVYPAFAESELRWRLSQGQVGWLFFLGQRPVHCRWEARGSAFLWHFGVCLALDRGEVFHLAGHTRREFRRLGLSTFSRALLLAMARDQGCRRVIAAADWWNRPSLRSFTLKSRMQPLGSLVRWKLGPLSRLKATGGLALGSQGELRVKTP